MYIHGHEMAVPALNKQAMGHILANDWLLLLSTDLATFYDICSTTELYLSPFGCLTSSRVFPHHFCGSPPPPTNHSYTSTCGIDEKLSKMAGNSARCSLKSS